MSLIEVTYLDVLHELCLQAGYALLLTAAHSPPGFAERSSTTIRNLDVIRPVPKHPGSRLTRRQRLNAGELVVRCKLEKVGGDLDAAAELLVQILTRAREQAA